ncbi:restriction endonuclease subunit S [Polynucleobacter sp. 31A-FELB]|uniref:restriction endonuclease subunit S n=1 Tax=Polynucleobacter sp. 31A-FELB TaxID=2689096 RepID=UPI001C0C6E27|nr:restriction endonuclease subunit S [Polynucleobacter sp. 31A-FELB]
MTFARYSKYKAVDVPWIQEIPSHWGFQSIKSILVERIEKNSPIKTKDILSLTMDRGVIPYAERGGGGNKAKEDISSYKLAYPGDIVLNSMNVVAGSVGLSKYFGAVSPVYYMLYARNADVNIGYYDKIFSSTVFQRSLLGLGNGILMKETELSGKLNTIRLKIPIDKLNIQYLPLPPVDEQMKISGFLEEINFKVNKLIQKQEKLISLLMEKRQALISNYITRGIYKNTPLKESNVEWYGEIPAHWEVTKFKFLLNESLQYGANESGDAGQEGWPRYIRITDIDSDGNLKNESIKTLNPELAAPYILKHGDILFARSGGTVGKSFIFDGAYGESCFAGYLIKASVDSTRILPEYLKYITESHMYWEYILGTQSQSTIQNVSAEKYARLPIPLPTIDEQHVICKKLDAVCNKMNELVSKSKESVSLLQEHRASLISAAVTGKIDVRELA